MQSVMHDIRSVFAMTTRHLFPMIVWFQKQVKSKRAKGNLISNKAPQAPGRKPTSR